MAAYSFDETRLTGKHIQDVLPDMLQQMGKRVQQNPSAILAAWPKVIGERLASMTHAVAFVDGVLKVRVKNSTLYSLLAQHEKSRLLKRLQEQFPSVVIRDLTFRMG